MERRRLINIYEANGLNEMQLRSHQDLLKCHGIIANDIKGYEQLDNEDKAIYQEFIINFFNSYGLKARNKIIPRRIYRVTDEPIQYLRFEFEYDYDDTKQWLHVISPNKFY